MKLTEILDERSILADLSATSKSEVIRELADVLSRNHPEIDAGELVRVLLERERLGSTGLESGVAIPHGKLTGIDKVVAAFGRSRSGVDFESIDKKPSTLFFLLVAPESSTGAHLKALAQIVKASKEPWFRGAMTEAADAQEIYEIISRADERL